MKALVKTDEVILLNERTDPFVIRHLAWMQTQGYTLNENWEPLTNDEQVPPAVSEVTETETAEETAAEETVTTSETTSSLGSDDSVIVINGKTYTKAELEAVLKNL